MAERQRADEPVLRLKVTGPGVGSGRISVPDLVKICEQVQAAVSRQAEAMEGRQTLRPGPVTAKAKIECTLDLLGIERGSAVLPFAIAKSQMPLGFPDALTLGVRAVVEVATAVASLGAAEPKEIDPGVLDSLNNLGTIFDRRAIKSIEFIVPKNAAKTRGLRAVYTPTVRERVAARIKAPFKKPLMVEGTLEMADFRPGDHKCRISPSIGQPVICVFDESQESQVEDNLRKPVRIRGEAVADPYSGRTDQLRIETLEPIRSFAIGAQEFHIGRSFTDLAGIQGVQPLKNANTLAGAFAESESVDEMLEEISRERT